MYDDEKRGISGDVGSQLSKNIAVKSPYHDVPRPLLCGRRNRESIESLANMKVGG